MSKAIPLLLALVLFAGACSRQSRPVPGPDKQGAGTVSGAMLGAGAGAVYGAQISAGTGAGAIAGAGIGAVYGAVSGLALDSLEEEQLRQEKDLYDAQKKTWAQAILTQHYEKRLELHPNRDIYPADLFFADDGVKLRQEGKVLVHEIATLTRERMPWSRIVIASYVTSRSSDSEYANYLSTKRAEEIAIEFVRAGLEGRRVLIQGVTLPEPIVVDPYDSPDRYRQAVEVIPIDY